MPSKLSTENLKKLELLWQKLRQIETLWNQEILKGGKDPGFLSAQILAELQPFFQGFDLNTALSFELQKCLEIEKHLKASLSLKQFLMFLLPIERLLQKNLTDEDFLVNTTDQQSKAIQKIPLVVVLDHIRSSFNVGSILRTCECFGVSEVILIGYTPTPENSKTQKAAMGVESYIKWSSQAELAVALEDLKKQGYRLVALETSQKAKPLYADFSKTPTAFVLGNERFGLGPDCLRLCDEIREIPLSGIKNSLNVGTTAAIAISEWKRQYEL